MNASLPLAIALVASPVSVPGTEVPALDAGTALRFVRPLEHGLSITTNETHDITLEALTTRRGDDAPVQQAAAMRLRSRASVAAVEEVAGAPGVAWLRRRFVDAAATLQVMDPADVDEEAGKWSGLEIPLASRLPGVGVTFVPAPAEPGGYGRHYDGRTLDESLLPALAAPVDWSTLLPPPGDDGAAHSLELGDTWALDGRALEPLLAPAGWIDWHPAEEPVPDPKVVRAFSGGVGGNLQLAFGGTVEGDATAELTQVGFDSSDGRYAELTMVFDLSLRADRDEFVDGERIAEAGELDVEMAGADLAVRLVGEASVRWSLELDRPLRALVVARETVEMTVRVRGADGVIAAQTIRMRGAIANNAKWAIVPLSPARRAVVAPPTPR